MKHGNLRIAWSVPWGIVAVLLCMLWLRSYGATYFPTWWRGHSVRLVPGAFLVDEHTYANRPMEATLNSQDTTSPWAGAILPPIVSSRFTMPLSALALLALVPAVGPWLPWRFSLRTLLVATTLVAVGLGLIVWAMR